MSKIMCVYMCVGWVSVWVYVCRCSGECLCMCLSEWVSVYCVGWMGILCKWVCVCLYVCVCMYVGWVCVYMCGVMSMCMYVCVLHPLRIEVTTFLSQATPWTFALWSYSTRTLRGLAGESQSHHSRRGKAHSAVMRNSAGSDHLGKHFSVFVRISHAKGY